MRTTRLLCLLAASTSLVGCAADKDTILPANGATMERIYTRHFTDIGLREHTSTRRSVQARRIRSDASDLAGYTRDAYNELDLHFPRLPNPTLVLYVYPHLAGPSRAPVPGYATTFSLYERIEYALPGEVHGQYHHSNVLSSE